MSSLVAALTQSQRVVFACCCGCCAQRRVMCKPAVQHAQYLCSVLTVLGFCQCTACEAEVNVRQVAGLQMAGGSGPSCVAAQMPMLQAFRHIVQREGIKALWKVLQVSDSSIWILHVARWRAECQPAVVNILTWDAR